MRSHALNLISGRRGEEGGARQPSVGGGGINRVKQARINGYVDALGRASINNGWHKGNDDPLWNIRGAGRRRGSANIPHGLKVTAKGLTCHFVRLVQSIPPGSAAGKVRESDGVSAVILKGYISNVLHGFLSGCKGGTSAPPSYFVNGPDLADGQVPLRVLYRQDFSPLRVLEMVVRAFNPHKGPSLFLQAFDYLPAARFHVYEYTHSWHSRQAKMCKYLRMNGGVA